MDQKEPEERSSVKNKHRNQNRGLKKIVLGGAKENEARKALAFQNMMKASGRVDFARTHQERVQAVFSTCIKAEARRKEEKAREVPFHSHDSQNLKNSVEDGQSYSSNQTIGIPRLPTTDRRMSGRPLRARYKHFNCNTIWDQTSDNSPLFSSSSFLNLVNVQTRMRNFVSLLRLFVYQNAILFYAFSSMSFHVVGPR